MYYLIKRIETQRKDTGVKRNEQFSNVDKKFLEMELEYQKKESAYREQLLTLEHKIELTQKEVDGVKDRLKTVDVKLDTNAPVSRLHPEKPRYQSPVPHPSTSPSLQHRPCSLQ